MSTQFNYVYYLLHLLLFGEKKFNTILKTNIVMKKCIIFLMLLLPLITLSQEFKIINKDLYLELNPYSHEAFGQLEALSNISINYYSIELIYVYNRNIYNDPNENENLIGIGLIPLNFYYNKYFINSGIIYFINKFPEVNRGANLNFKIQIGYNIYKYISITYTHISNGFNLFHEYNPGLDMIGIKLNINKLFTKYEKDTMSKY